MQGEKVLFPYTRTPTYFLYIFRTYLDQPCTERTLTLPPGLYVVAQDRPPPRVPVRPGQLHRADGLGEDEDPRDARGARLRARGHVAGRGCGIKLWHFLKKGVAVDVDVDRRL